MNRTALVTGGSGFIGTHLTNRLLANEWNVRVLDLREPSVSGDVAWIDADVRNEKMVSDAARGTQTVFHLGSIVGVEDVLADPITTVDVTVNGTLNAVRAAGAAGAGMIHFSTSEVLGADPAVPAGENDDRVVGSPEIDRWSYASAKAASEHIITAAERVEHVPATIIRPFNVYGPGQSDRFAIGRMVHAAIRGIPIEVHGTGDQTRCFTYIDDFIDAVMGVINHVGLARIVNIGSNEEVSIKQLAELIEELSGSTAGRVMTAVGGINTRKEADIRRRVPDTSMITKLLGWSPKIPLRVGLSTTIAASRADQCVAYNPRATSITP